MTKFHKIPFSPLMLALLLNACGGTDKPAASTASGGGMPPIEVDVITITSGNATYTQDLPGRIQAYRTAQVRARVDGVVEQRLFQEGSEIKAGKSLYRIDPRIYQSSAIAAKAEAGLAALNVERYRRLLEAKLVSQQAYDQALTTAKQTEAARIKADEDAQNASVPAPISGHIGRAQVTEGALVSKSEATLLATIEQVDPIYVNFTESGSDLLRLRQAIASGVLKRADSTKVELLLEDGSIYAHKGKIFFTDLAVDSATGSVSLRAEFPNPKRELLPGMFVSIRFPEALADNVFRVPQRAVQMSSQGQFVMIVDGESKASPLPVKAGAMAGTDFVIESGLKGGEQVIVNGLQKARPGTVVKPIPLENTMKTENPLSVPK